MADHRSRWPIITSLYNLSKKYKHRSASYDITGLWTFFAEVDQVVNNPDFKGDATAYAAHLRAIFETLPEVQHQSHVKFQSRHEHFESEM